MRPYLTYYGLDKKDSYRSSGVTFTPQSRKWLLNPDHERHTPQKIEVYI